MLSTIFRLSLFLLILSLYACATVPVTGRTQLDLIPQSTMLSTSASQYSGFLKENPISKNKEQTEMVKRTGKRIQKAVESFFAQNNLSSELKGYQWEFNLVDSNEVNAWCMPGGKVVVYSGILPVAQTETGLAVVMGHEIAHAVARHGNERMSQGMIQQFGGVALAVAMKDQPRETQALWLAAYGAGSTLGVMLPYSRLHESEADHLGLIFMAMAGYDPSEAVNFWSRMAAKKDGKSPPELLSTHPSDTTRINKIKSLLPEANTYYQRQ